MHILGHHHHHKIIHISTCAHALSLRYSLHKLVARSRHINTRLRFLVYSIVLFGKRDVPTFWLIWRGRSYDTFTDCGSPKTVFVMGGGEGSAAREALKHKSMERVVMCDIDQVITTPNIALQPSIEFKL